MSPQTAPGNKFTVDTLPSTLARTEGSSPCQVLLLQRLPMPTVSLTREGRVYSSGRRAPDLEGEWAPPAHQTAGCYAATGPGEEGGEGGACPELRSLLQKHLLSLSPHSTDAHTHIPALRPSHRSEAKGGRGDRGSEVWVRETL